VRRDDDIIQAEQRVVRPPVSDLGRLLLDVVESRARDPALGERSVKRAIVDDRRWPWLFRAARPGSR
jgi:hypothetical protein